MFRIILKTLPLIPICDRLWEKGPNRYHRGYENTAGSPRGSPDITARITEHHREDHRASPRGSPSITARMVFYPRLGYSISSLRLFDILANKKHPLMNFIVKVFHITVLCFQITGKFKNSFLLFSKNSVKGLCTTKTL